MPEFRDFCHELNPAYRVPCRATVTKNVCQTFLDQCEAVRAGFLTLGSRPAVTADLWQDRRCIHRLGITLHFISSDWEMYQVSLGVYRFDVQHSSEEIAV